MGGWTRDGEARQEVRHPLTSSADLETDPDTATPQPVTMPVPPTEPVEWRTYSPRKLFALPNGASLRITRLWRARGLAEQLDPGAGLPISNAEAGSSKDADGSAKDTDGSSRVAAASTRDSGSGRYVLGIEIQIQAGSNESTPYSSWNGTGALGRAARAELLDDADRNCRLLDPDERAAFPPAPDVALESGQPLRDTLFFEWASNTADEVRLRLPLAAIGIPEKDLAVRIATSEISEDSPVALAVDEAPKPKPGDGLRGMLREHARAKEHMPEGADPSGTPDEPMEGKSKGEAKKKEKASRRKSPAAPTASAPDSEPAGSVEKKFSP